MAEANWVQLAQTGDATAIAVLMNASLQTIGIRARAAMREGSLHVLLESERALTPRSCAEFLRHGIEQLGLGWVSEAIVYSRTPGQPVPHWIERVELAAPVVDNPFVLPPHAALEEAFFSLKPPFIHWKRVCLFDLLLLSVPVLVVLTSVYIWSRYLGAGSIAPPGSTPAPIAAPVAAPTDRFQAAQAQAAYADRQTQRAKLQNKREWRQVTAAWQQASELMQAVPSTHPQYALAQQKMREYQQNAKSLMDLKLNAAPEMVLKRTIEQGMSPRSIVHAGRDQVFAPMGQYGHAIAVFNRDEELIQQISDQVKLADFGYSQFPGTQQGSPAAAIAANAGLSLWVANDQMTGAGLQRNNDETCTPADSLSSGFLYRVSTDTLSLDRVVQVGASPKSLAASPDDRYILASNWCSWDVSVVDAQQNREIRRIAVGAYPRGIAIAAQTKTAYVAVQGANAIATINLKDFSTTQIPDVGQAPQHLVLDPAGQFLYVSLMGDGQVAKLDLSSRAIVGKVATGKAPRSLALSDDGQFLYVVNYDSDTVSKIRTQEMQVVQTVQVSSAPIGVTYDPKTHQVWVASTSGSIQIFQD